MRPTAALTASLAATLTAAVIASLLAPQPATAGSWVWPVSGDVITPYSNGDDPYAAGQHRGIDIAAAVGTPVVAAAGGEVRFAGTAGSSGLTVSVRTGDGFDTSYLHLSSVAVRAGSQVSAGDRLGAVGTSGARSADQAHLHFGVREAGTRHAYRDPLSFLPARPAFRPAEPPPTPAPLPAPAPITPNPAPAPAPRPAPRRTPAGAPRRTPLGAPRRIPVGAPRRIPVGTPRRTPLGAPRRIPVGAPRRIPAGAPRPAPRGSPSHARTAALRRTRSGPPHPVMARAAHRASATGPQRAPLGDRPDTPARARASQLPGGPAMSETTQGPDVGWALACAGLLLAAAIVGLTGDGRRTTARGRSVLLRAVRALPARR